MEKIKNYLIHLEPPFYKNTEDNLHCFEMVLKMILKHFIPEREFTLDELLKITGKTEGKWTWATQAMIKLQEINFDVVTIETFDWSRFSEEGTTYLREFYDDETAQLQANNSNIKKEMENAKNLAEKTKISSRVPTVEDFQKFQRFGYLFICNVNSHALYNEPGYTGHFVLVYKADEEYVYFHDPGLPDKKSVKMPKEQFEKAWAYPNEENKNLTMVRLKSPYKVFGIGLSRTATSSLNEALLELGYFAIHYPLDWEIIDRADALTDIPIAYRYKELDRKYPGAKFILTKRNLFSWLISVRKHYKRKPAASRSEETLKHRERMYGTVNFCWWKMAAVKIRHERQVRKYFKDRPNDFIEIDIVNGDSWENLCNFLDKEIPDIPFPKVNTSKERKLKTQ